MNILETKIVNNIIDDTGETTEQNKNNSIYDSDLTTKSNIDLKVLLKRGPKCELIVVDNFYNNPIETRNYILTQDFFDDPNYPGKRSISYVSEDLKEIIQKFVLPFGGKITHFPCPKQDGSDASEIYNGAFHYRTSADRSFIHSDNSSNWIGVIYMTPDAPLSSGTGFYKFKDGSTCEEDSELLKNKPIIERFSKDSTKWELVDRVGNVFNRLVLFNSHRYHMDLDYFGDTKKNSRLYQIFSFSTNL